MKLPFSTVLLAALWSAPVLAGPLVGPLLPPTQVEEAQATGAFAPPAPAPIPVEVPGRGGRAWLGVLGGGLLVPALVGTGAFFTLASPVRDPAERLAVSALWGAAAGWVSGPLAVAWLSDVRGIVPRLVLGALAGAVLCIPAVFIPVVGWAVFMAGPALGALWAVETAPGMAANLAFPR